MKDRAVVLLACLLLAGSYSSRAEEPRSRAEESRPETVLSIEHVSSERSVIRLNEDRLGELVRQGDQTLLVAHTEVALFESREEPQSEVQSFPKKVTTKARLATSPVEIREEFVLLAPPSPLWIEGLGLEVESDAPGLNREEHEMLRDWLKAQGLPGDTAPFQALHQSDTGRELRVWYEIAGRRQSGQWTRSDRPTPVATLRSGFRSEEGALKIHHKRPGENGRFTYHRESLELASSLSDEMGSELVVHECGCYGYAIAADLTTLGDSLYQVEADWLDDRVGAEFFVGWTAKEAFPWFGIGDRRRMRDLARRVTAYNLRDATGLRFARVDLELPEDPAWPDLGDVTYRIWSTSSEGGERELARAERTPTSTRIVLYGEPAAWEDHLERLDRLLAAMPIQVQRGDGIRDSQLGQIETWIDQIRLLREPSLARLSDVTSDMDAVTATEKVRRLLQDDYGSFTFSGEPMPPRPILVGDPN